MGYLATLLVVCVLAFNQAAAALPQGLDGAPVNINTATAQQLAAALSGVGLKRAQAIVEYRRQYGDFIAIEELLEVAGIGPSVLEGNRDRILLSD